MQKIDRIFSEGFNGISGKEFKAMLKEVKYSYQVNIQKVVKDYGITIYESRKLFTDRKQAEKFVMLKKLSAMNESNSILFKSHISKIHI